MGIVFKQSLKNTLFIYLGFFIGGINTIFLYTNFLKSEYYGLVAYILSASNLIMPLAAFGVHYTIVKFYSSYGCENDKDRFLNSMLFVPLLTSLPIGFLWNYIHNYIVSIIPDSNKIIENYTIYIYIIAVACAYFELFYAWAKVQMQSVFGNILKELWNRVIAMILLFFVFFDIITKQEFIHYFAIAYIIRVFVMMLYAFRLRLPKFSFKLPDNFSEVLKYTFYIVLAGSASAVILDIDKVMIPSKETLNKAAYYTVAVFIGSFIEAPSRAMTQILQPLTSKSINENNHKEVANLYKKSSINLLVVGGLFFLLINTNISELFKIIPEKEYADGIFVVLMISMAKLYLMLLGNNNAIIGNSKYYKMTLPIGVGMALTVYFLNKWLFSIMGTDGLALATFITVFVFSSFKIWFVKNRLGISPITKKTGVILLIILGLFFIFNYRDFSVAKISIWGFSISPVINIMLKSVIIVLVYIFLIYKLNISNQITELINRFIKK